MEANTETSKGHGEKHNAVGTLQDTIPKGTGPTPDAIECGPHGGD